MVKKNILIALVVFLVMGYGVLEQTKTVEKDNLFNAKVAASEHLEQIFGRIKAYRIEIDGNIDSSVDLNETGLLGPRYTRITTTLGALESKRTSANPNMAALLVQLITDAGLVKGDTVAVNVSGSFPALNFAVIAAAETMDIDTIIISSIGASTYGANHEELTYLDMEQRLFNEGVIDRKSIAFSNGGAEDLGLDMDSEVLKQIIDRHSDKIHIYFEEYDQNIAYRMSLYDQAASDIDLFINVGGNLVSGGESDVGYGIDNGLINPSLELNYSDKGLIGAFLDKGISVVHLLNIKDLAMEYGISIDPVPLTPIAEEGIFFSYKYNTIVISVLLFFGVGGLASYGYIRNKEIKEALRRITA